MPRNLWTAMLAVGFLQTAPAMAEGIWRGPYLNDVSTDAITIVWETPTPMGATVHYGSQSAYEHSVTTSGAATHQAVRLTGLQAVAGGAGLEIHYAVQLDGTVPGDSTAGLRAGIFSLAVDAQTPFAFIVYGDNRSNRPQYEAVVQALQGETAPVRFLLNSGDMVSDGQDELDWDMFFDVGQPLLATLPIYTTLGNHEVDDGAWDVTERIFEHPTGVEPASNTEAYYQFVYGNLQVIVVDGHANTLYRFENYSWPGTQERWLQDVLDNPPAEAQHRIVIVHAGPYSSKNGRTGSYWLRAWLDAFKDAGVNVVLSGHDHYGERGWASNGLHYIIHGGGGAPLYDTLGPRKLSERTISYSESRLGYVLVEVDGPMMEISIKGQSGELFDYVAYGDETNPECAIDADCDAFPEPPYACDNGAYSCINQHCAYTCPGGLISLVACWTDGDCSGVPCFGDTSCEKPEDFNPLSWHCACSARECVGDTNCAGRAPPIDGCVGDWACVTDVCEFTPAQGICYEPAPDGGDSAHDDGGPSGAMGDSTTSPAAGGDNNNAEGSEVGQAGGCGCSNATSTPWLWVGLMFLTLRFRSRIAGRR